MLNEKNVLITGGTGSFGKKATEIILRKYKPRRLIIFSRDELKQFEMAQQFPNNKYACIRYFIGDVRDKERLERAFHGVDYVIHAAALKQVLAMAIPPPDARRFQLRSFDGRQSRKHADTRQRTPVGGHSRRFRRFDHAGFGH